MYRLLALSLLSFAAQAQTIVPGAQCNAYCTCLDVPIDTELVLNYVTPTAVSIDGDVFTGPAVYPSQMFDGKGGVLVVNLNFSRWTTKTTSGRGAGAKVQHCALVGGSIQR